MGGNEGHRTTESTTTTTSTTTTQKINRLLLDPQKDSRDLLEIELKRLENAVVKLEESNRYLERELEKEDANDEDFGTYATAIKENAKTIPEYQSKIFEMSKRLREAERLENDGSKKEEEGGSQWL
tara:strand:- start:184 stop:561 length:378 start_codon:yes stop_codon:yes gene_type:complete